MRIASVGPAPPWRGGISQYHYALASQLVTEGAEVHVLNFSKLYPHLLFPGTTAADTGDGALPDLGEAILRPLWPPSWKRGAGWIGNHNPGAVICHWWHPFFALSYLGVLKRIESNIATGFICHNVASHEGMPMSTILTRKVIRRGDFFVTGGEEMAGQIREINPRAAVEVVLHPRYDLPYTGDLPDRIEARGRLGIVGPGAVFLFFGLVRKYKGLDTLLDALAMLPSEGNWTCLVVGEFYESKEPYEEQIRTLGLTDRVRVEDRYIPNSEVPFYFAAADLTVLPYRHATQSGVAALSFAMNRPVVTTRVGALPEMIIEGENGWLIPPEDPDALSAVLTRVVGDPAVARLPVVNGLSGLPDWSDLARAVMRLAGASTGR